MKKIIKTLLITALFASPVFGTPDARLDVNMLEGKNPGCESGVGLWTASAGTIAADTSTPTLGNGSCTWDASAGSQQVESALVTIPLALRSQSCTLRFIYDGGDANLDVSVRDQTDSLVGSATKTLAVQSSPTEDHIDFTCPASGSLKMRIASTADAASIEWDAVFLGRNARAAASDVTRHYGEIAGATSCSWELPTATTYTDFPDDDDCPALSSTSGGMSQLAASATDNRPGFRIASFPAGIYLFIIKGPIACVGGDGDDICSFQLTDGTSSIVETTIIGSAMGTGPVTLMGTFEETSGRTDVDFHMEGFSTDGSSGETPTIRLNDDSGTGGDNDAAARLIFEVIRLK